jgi:hypothetical protein
MPSVDTVRLSNHQLHEAIAVTARAFWPDPLFGYFARDSVREHQNMPRFVQAILNDAMHHGEVDAAISKWTKNTQMNHTCTWRYSALTPLPKEKASVVNFFNPV